MKRDEEERRKMFQNMVQNGQNKLPPSPKLAETNLLPNVFLPPPILPQVTVPQNDPFKMVDMPTTTTRAYRQRTYGYVSLSLEAGVLNLKVLLKIVENVYFENYSTL